MNKRVFEAQPICSKLTSEGHPYIWISNAFAFDDTQAFLDWVKSIVEKPNELSELKLVMDITTITENIINSYSLPDENNYIPGDSIDGYFHIDSKNRELLETYKQQLQKALILFDRIKYQAK